jgi:hypothetical protein
MTFVLLVCALPESGKYFTLDDVLTNGNHLFDQLTGSPKKLKPGIDEIWQTNYASCLVFIVWARARASF